MRDAAAFLIQPARDGYPTDYLLARLRYRHGELVGARTFPPRLPGATPLQARGRMHQEFRWVYLLMNRQLRKTFAPFFLWFELPTVLVCLRHLRTGDRGEAARNLADSLMGEELRTLLTSSERPFDAGSPLAELAGGDSREARALEGWYREQKGREYEQRLAALYLGQVTRQPLHPVLHDFFASMVDLKNLVAAAKELRWEVSEPSPLIAGGHLSGKRLEKVLKERDEAELFRLLSRFPGHPAPEAVPEKLEHALLGHLTRRLRGNAADRLGAGFILAYLWECHLEARNSALAFHAESFGADLLAEELIA